MLSYLDSIVWAIMTWYRTLHQTKDACRTLHWWKLSPTSTSFGLMTQSQFPPFAWLSEFLTLLDTSLRLTPFAKPSIRACFVYWRRA